MLSDVSDVERLPAMKLSGWVAEPIRSEDACLLEPIFEVGAEAQGELIEQSDASINFRIGAENGIALEVLQSGLCLAPSRIESSGE